MSVIESLVFYTFLIQGILFPFLIIIVTIYIFKGIFKKARYRNDKELKKVKQKKNDSLPALKPLQCKSCGGAVPLKENYTHCQYCDANVEIPKDYLAVANMRKDTALHLKKAEEYWRKARIYTSPLIKWFLRLLYFWLIFTIIILIKNDGTPQQEELFAKVKDMLWGLGEWIEALSLLTIACWIILIMATIWGIGTKSRNFLPTVEMPKDLKKDEKAVCSTCGAGIEFTGTDLATLCNYCGVETYRAKFALKMKVVETEKRDKSTFSLIEAMEAYKEALENIVTTPAALILIFIILPFFVILVPKMLYEYFSENLLPLLIFIALVIGLILFAVFRRKKIVEQGK